MVFTFTSLGINPKICESCCTLGWTEPTNIQRESIPPALEGFDIFAIAETGSGKTASFAIPIIEKWLKLDKPVNFALILSPTRELAIQITSCFDDLLPANEKLKATLLIGGLDFVEQAINIGLNDSHVFVATPGRLIEHMETSKGMVKQLHQIQMLILDEADRMLNLQFQKALKTIVKSLSRSKRQTLLFSATLTNRVKDLKKLCIPSQYYKNISISSKYATVEGLSQYHIQCDFDSSELYLEALVRWFLTSFQEGQTDSCYQDRSNGVIVFCNSCADTERLSMFLRNMEITAVPINGHMKEHKRTELLTKFIIGERDVLVATDVASRGLDIPHVGLVINFDVPVSVKDYQHRVGRTARAGNKGMAVTIVTNVYKEIFEKKIESHLERPIVDFDLEKFDIEKNKTKVINGLRLASKDARMKLRKMKDD